MLETTGRDLAHDDASNWGMKSQAHVTETCASALAIDKEVPQHDDMQAGEPRKRALPLTICMHAVSVRAVGSDGSPKVKCV